MSSVRFQAGDFGKALDALESAFSDSSRQGIRQIKTEWLKVVKYKNNLLVKGDEVAAAKEKIAYLKELECQNEKYLRTAQSRLQNLKESDIQLRRKLGDLRKEAGRLVEKSNREEEYMQKKLSFYEEKWRRKLETGNSKNPQFQEMRKAIFEREELERKLLSLEQEFRKSEKDLFQAKCERNGRTRDEGEDARSFEDFVVKIARMHVDAKRALAECEETRREIRTIEKNAEKMRDSARSRVAEKNNILRSSEAEWERVDVAEKAGQNVERDSTSEQSFVETRGEDRPVPLRNFAEDNNCTDNAKISTAESNVVSLSNFGNAQSKPAEGRNTSFEIFDDRGKMSDGAGKESFAGELEKLPSAQCKVRKWMERLKIHVPKFDSDGGKTESEDRGRQKPPECSEYICASERKAISDTRRPRETFMNSNVSIRAESFFASGTFGNTVKSRDLNRFSSPVKIQKSDMCVDRSFTEQISTTLKNTSKYFGKKDSTSAMDWEEVEPPANGSESAKVNGSPGRNVDAATVQNDKNCPTVQNATSRDDDEIPQTDDLSGKIPEERRVEDAGASLGEEGRKEDIDTEMVEITPESDTVPDGCSRMEVTDFQPDDVKANSQTASVPGPTSESAVEEPSARQPSDLRLDQVMTRERRELRDREVSIVVDRQNPTPNVHPKADTPSTAATPTAPSDGSNPGGATQEILTAASNFPAFRSDSNPSPGFAYATRMMFEARASPGESGTAAFKKDLPKNAVAQQQLAFFGKSLPKSPEEDFLASAYEDYLEDSPPASKCREKSMFQFVDDSPEKGGFRDDFFPLFGGGVENGNGNGGESNGKDSGSGGGQFTFNFGGKDEKSPEETSGFKFLF